MKAILTILLYLSICSWAHGQPKFVQIPSDDSFWYDYAKKEREAMDLTDLLESKNDVHFRFWTGRQLVDVWKGDGNKFEGKLFSYIHRESCPNCPHELIYKKRDLDSVLAGSVYRLFFDNGIFNMPTGKSIAGWGRGDDGVTYIIEYATPKQYSLKTYWSPDAEKDIKEAIILQNVIDKADVLLKMKQYWQEYTHSLPNGSYGINGIGMTCFTKKQYRKFKKGKFKYSD